MYNTCKNLIIILLLLSFELHAWEVAKQGDGVIVYTQAVEGSELKQFRATVRVKSTLAGLVALIKDVDTFKNWYPDCSESRVASAVSATEWYSYARLKAPFPVSDRDSYNHVKVIQDPNSKVVTISLNALPSFAPATPGAIRVPKLVGYWQFSPGADGFVDVAYQVHSDPGGSIPNFVANGVIVDGPFKALSRLQGVVAKYQSSKLSFIKEK